MIYDYRNITKEQFKKIVEEKVRLRLEKGELYFAFVNFFDRLAGMGKSGDSAETDLLRKLWEAFAFLRKDETNFGSTLRRDLEKFKNVISSAAKG